MKPVVPRVRADFDIRETTTWYAEHAGGETALGFIDDLEQAFGQLSSTPGIGSPRWATELQIPGLRGWSLTRHPHTIFYLEHSERIDVLRVLHHRRDVSPRFSAEHGLG